MHFAWKEYKTHHCGKLTRHIRNIKRDGYDIVATFITAVLHSKG